MEAIADNQLTFFTAGLAYQRRSLRAATLFLYRDGVLRVWKSVKLSKIERFEVNLAHN